MLFLFPFAEFAFAANILNLVKDNIGWKINKIFFQSLKFINDLKIGFCEKKIHHNFMVSTNYLIQFFFFLKIYNGMYIYQYRNNHSRWDEICKEIFLQITFCCLNDWYIFHLEVISFNLIKHHKKSYAIQTNTIKRTKVVRKCPYFSIFRAFRWLLH